MCLAPPALYLCLCKLLLMQTLGSTTHAFAKSTTPRQRMHLPKALHHAHRHPCSHQAKPSTGPHASSGSATPTRPCAHLSKGGPDLHNAAHLLLLWRACHVRRHGGSFLRTARHLVSCTKPAAHGARRPTPSASWCSLRTTTSTSRNAWQTRCSGRCEARVRAQRGRGRGLLMIGYAACVHAGCC